MLTRTAFRGTTALARSAALANARSLRSVAGTVVGVPKELEADERRIAQTPETVKELVKKGFQVRLAVFLALEPLC